MNNKKKALTNTCKQSIPHRIILSSQERTKYVAKKTASNDGCKKIVRKNWRHPLKLFQKKQPQITDIKKCTEKSAGTF
jgi:hypothetical protein